MSKNYSNASAQNTASRSSSIVLVNMEGGKPEGKDPEGQSEIFRHCNSDEDVGNDRHPNFEEGKNGGEDEAPERLENDDDNDSNTIMRWDG